jgi:hypothetical protein
MGNKLRRHRINNYEFNKEIIFLQAITPENKRFYRWDRGGVFRKKSALVHTSLYRDCKTAQVAVN